MSPTKVGAIVLLVVGVADFIVTRRICRILRDRYPLLHTDLGSPAFGLCYDWRSPFLRFLFKREYRFINDPELTRLGDLEQSLMWSFMGVIVLTILFSIALLLIHAQA